MKVRMRKCKLCGHWFQLVRFASHDGKVTFKDWAHIHGRRKLIACMEDN